MKTLGSHPPRATNEIDAGVRYIQEASVSSAEAVREIADTIRRVNEVSTAIVSAVEEQGATTQEISRNVQKAAHGKSEVSSNIGSVTHAAAETGRTPGTVLQAACGLARNGDVLHKEVEAFLREFNRAKSRRRISAPPLRSTALKDSHLLRGPRRSSEISCDQGRLEYLCAGGLQPCLIVTF